MVMVVSIFAGCGYGCPAGDAPSMKAETEYSKGLDVGPFLGWTLEYESNRKLIAELAVRQDDLNRQVCTIGHHYPTETLVAWMEREEVGSQLVDASKYENHHDYLHALRQYAIDSGWWPNKIFDSSSTPCRRKWSISNRLQF